MREPDIPTGKPAAARAAAATSATDPADQDSIAESGPASDDVAAREAEGGKPPATAGPGATGAKTGSARPKKWVGPLSGVLNTVGTAATQARTTISKAGQRLPAPIRPGKARARRERAPGVPDSAGMTLARLTSLPVIVVIAWLIPGLPLLLAGRFLPVPMLLIAVPLTVALAASGLRVVPGRWPRAGIGRTQDKTWTAWFGLLGTVAVAAGLTAWQLHMQSQSIIVARSPGAYLQTGYWLAQHGSLPIPQRLHAFGGAHAGLNFSSAGFIAHGTSIFPAMPSGLPMLLAAGFWAHSITGAQAASAVLGCLALLTFGGLVARLAGPQWAPGAVLVLGLTLPQQYTSRASFPETAMQILLLGGLCLLVDALTMRPAAPGEAAAGAGSRAGSSASGGAASGSAASGSAASGDSAREDGAAPGGETLVGGPLSTRGRLQLAAMTKRLAQPLRAALAELRRVPAWLTPQRSLAAMAGLAMGLGTLVSLNNLVYLLPVIPFGIVIVATRRPIAFPFCLGVLLGVGYGLADGYLLARPVIDTAGSTLEELAVAAVWLAALSIVVVQLLRLPKMRARVKKLVAGRPLRWLPELGSLLVVAALVGFAIRPLVKFAQTRPGPVMSRYIAHLQHLLALPVNPARPYSEEALYWVVWYLGLPALLLGGFGLALLTRRILRALLTWQDPQRAWRAWALPLAIICAGSAVVLWDPDISPDQPWGSRRLAVIVLPGLILAGMWAGGWLTGLARARGARAASASAVGLLCVVALLVPTVGTAFGLSLSHTGKGGGLRPVAQGLALRRVGIGETAAVRSLCATIPANASVVIISYPTAQKFSQVIRGICGLPTASMIGQPASAVDGVINAISSAGRRPVLLAARPAPLRRFGGTPSPALSLVTTMDPRELTVPPAQPWRTHYVIWMSIVGGPVSGT